MAEHLGRSLRLDEEVHHRDENPLNNHIDNLELLPKGEHKHKHGLGRKFTPERRQRMSQGMKLGYAKRRALGIVKIASSKLPSARYKLSQHALRRPRDPFTKRFVTHE